MPKLYHHAGSWQLPGKQDRKAAKAEVPDRAPELCAWLNARRVPLEGDAFDGIIPVNEAAHELLAAARGVTAEPTEGDFFRLGPSTKNPLRVAPAFLGDIEAGAEFVPVTKAAEIDRLLGRCPACHSSADAARQRIAGGELDAIRNWIETATAEQLDDLADLIEERRA